MSLINTQVQPFKTTAFVNRGGKGEFIEVTEQSLKGKWSVLIFMPALLAAVHSLRQLLFGHMPALGAALAGIEFAGRSVHPFATSFQHFVAK